jgi:hypothetical protein
MKKERSFQEKKLLDTATWLAAVTVRAIRADQMDLAEAGSFYLERRVALRSVKRSRDYVRDRVHWN